MPTPPAARCQTAIYRRDRGMNYCVEVATKPGFRDTRTDDLKDQIELLGIPGVDSVDIADRYYLGGTISPETLHRLTTSLLLDSVVHRT